MDLGEAAARAASEPGERALADLRRAVDEELEAAARDDDFRVRAQAYRAIGQLRFAQKTELLRRGLEDQSPACRGSALLSLELLSRDHPGLVNGNRPLLHELANADPVNAVRKLAILCLKNGSPAQDTITLLDHFANESEEQDLRQAAKSVADVLRRKSRER